MTAICFYRDYNPFLMTSQIRKYNFRSTLQSLKEISYFFLPIDYDINLFHTFIREIAENFAISFFFILLQTVLFCNKLFTITI